jgi:hypothetical protein
MKVGQGKIAGRACVVPDGDKTETIDVHDIFVAIGAKAEPIWQSLKAEEPNSLDLRHCRLTEQKIPVVFGGDLTIPAKSVTDAVASGKQAAMALDTYFKKGLDAVELRLAACRVGAGPAISMDIYLGGDRKDRSVHIVDPDEIVHDYFQSAPRVIPSSLDAFYLSHTFEPIDIPEQQLVDRFLPRISPRIKMDTADPCALNQLVTPAAYMEMRYNTQLAMETAQDCFGKIEKEFATAFNRTHGPVEAIRCRDADIIMVTTGTVTGTCRQVLADLRSRGEKVGLFKIKLFRPFPSDLICRHLGAVKKIAVVDRNVSFGAGGIFAQEIRAALCNLDRPPRVFSYVAGLGGRDITPNTLVEIYNETKKNSTPKQESVWIGLNQEIVETWRN